MNGTANGFYDRSRSPERFTGRLLNALADYPFKRDAILAVSRDFERQFGPARETFEARFGPVTSEQPIYLVHSLGEMDGGTRTFGGKTALMFGADMIAKIHAGHDSRPFFHHELFHLWHGARFHDCEPVWCSLWTEGLATYVAHQLNPGADDAALLLTVPAPIRPPVDANRGAALCALASRLDSTKDEDYAALFYGSRHLPGMPARMGYYLGYLVADDLGKSRSLAELGTLKPAEVRPLIDASLARMARC